MSWLNGSIMSDDEQVIKIAREYAEAEQAYLEKFGEDSLERVMETPHPITSSVSSYQSATIEILKRIKNNQPFEQVSEEEWKNFCF